MAAAPSSLGEQISEELTCSICLELFTRPKVLPCQHTFCQDCLVYLVADKKHFECANCRRHIKLPFDGVAGFRDNHLVTSLCERLQNQATLSGETREHVQPQSGNRCSFHPSEEAKLYCTQCQSPVCEVYLEDTHDGHSTTTIKKALQESKSTAQALVNEGRNILESYGLIEEEKRLNEQKQQRDNSINKAYNQMVQILTERRNQLLSESQQNHRENLEKIVEERHRALADMTELSTACNQAEQELEQECLGVNFLCREIILTEVVGKYRGKAAPTPVQTQPAVFQPTDTPVPVLGHVTVQSLPSAPLPAAPAPIRVVPAPVPAAATCSIGNVCNKAQTITLRVEDSETEEFRLLFNFPARVTVSEEGEIFVADRRTKRIQVFTLQGTFVRLFPTVVCMSGEEMMIPDDVAIDRKGNLWVVGRTKSAHFAVQYNKQGRVLRKIALEDTCWERGVAVDPRRNHILITQTTSGSFNWRGEVLVFRPDGRLVRTVGHQPGMEFPQYMNIAVDGERNILVSDWCNDRVYVYNKDGTFLFQFGGEGSGEGQLKWPHGIYTDRAGNIIVADSKNNRVEMFDKTGKFLKHIVTDMTEPQAVAMAPQGQLVVTDNKKHTVTIFPNF